MTRISEKTDESHSVASNTNQDPKTLLPGLKSPTTFKLNKEYSYEQDMDNNRTQVAMLSQS